jgi:tetratricopeptide (TPR) repeat protein
MAGLGDGLRKLFAPETRRGGLSQGDPALLELLDLNLLRREAGEADVAAGRVGAKDRPQRLLESAVVWREVARRTADAAALRKSASAAELAWSGFERDGRTDCARRARRNQAYAAMLGAELFGEDGLNAAAEFVLSQAQDSAQGSAKTRGALARLSARKVLASGGVSEALSASARFDGPLQVLEARDKPAAARLRCERAELMAGCGARLHDPLLFDMALKDTDVALRGLDPAFRPLTWLHVQEVRGFALIGLGETHADVGPVVDAVSILTAAADHLTPDHSPLDWARIHNVLGQGLAALGEAEACEGAFERALEQYAHALRVLRQFPSLALRAAVALNRAGCMVRRAEIAGDLYALDEAEAIFRSELAALGRPVDAASWAVLQINLARVYVARAAANGRDRGEGARAAEALTGALEVFNELGLRPIAVLAAQELERLRQGSRRLAS